ncbi:MAG TPA: ABC transporter substrate-binding protein [Spirillospora sp.]|nr:ABC transporter substrate-binding protein [Spirillospora sp.]
MAARSRTRVLILLAAAITAAVVLIQNLPRPEPAPEELFPTGEMRIAVDASNPPFAVATADDLFGLEIDLGEALADHFGLPARFVNMSFDGLYDSLKADQADLVIAMLTIDPLRTGDVLYTRHYFDAGLVLVSPLERPIQSMRELAGHRLAYEFGSNADTLARRWLRRIHPFETAPYELPSYALDAVRFGHADAALVDAVSARLHLREHQWQAALHYVTNNWYPIAVPIDEVARWQALNRALQILDDNGTLDRIITKWL